MPSSVCRRAAARRRSRVRAARRALRRRRSSHRRGRWIGCRRRLGGCDLVPVQREAHHPGSERLEPCEPRVERAWTVQEPRIVGQAILIPVAAEAAGGVRARQRTAAAMAARQARVKRVILVSIDAHALHQTSVDELSQIHDRCVSHALHLSRYRRVDDEDSDTVGAGDVVERLASRSGPARSASRRSSSCSRRARRAARPVRLLDRTARPGAARSRCGRATSSGCAGRSAKTPGSRRRSGSGRGLDGSRERQPSRIDERAEDQRAVGRAEQRVDRVLRMRHQAEDVPVGVQDAGDVGDRAVRVLAGRVAEQRSGRSASSSVEQLGVGEPAALAVLDRDRQLPGRRSQRAVNGVSARSTRARRRGRRTRATRSGGARPGAGRPRSGSGSRCRSRARARRRRRSSSTARMIGEKRAIAPQRR